MTEAVNDAIVLAAQHRNIVLLDQSGADPSAHKNRALCVAAACGFSDVVSVLLADHRVQISPNLGAELSKAARLASRNGHAALAHLTENCIHHWTHWSSS